MRAPRRRALPRWKKKVILRGFWALMLPVIIIGGLKFGVFTPTESAVVAAVYAGFVGTVVYRRLAWADIKSCFINAAKTTSVVMFLVAASMVASWLITVADLPGEVVKLLEPFMDSKILLMFMMMLLVLIVGTALDFVPTVLILTPVLMPIVKAADIDPVYFGVMFIMNNSIGLLTPPVGTVLNVVCGVARVPMDGVIRGVWPFLFADVRDHAPDSLELQRPVHIGKVVQDAELGLVENLWRQPVKAQVAAEVSQLSRLIHEVLPVELWLRERGMSP